MQRRFDLIRWTPGRATHIARHGIKPEEVDEVLSHEASRLRRGRAGRYLLYGRTAAGRRLLVVLVDEGRRIAGVVTGRAASEAEGRTYFD